MTYNLSILHNNTKGRYDNLDNFTVVLHCLGIISNTDVDSTTYSFNQEWHNKIETNKFIKEWHNKIEEAKDNLKNWEESLQSFLLFEDRPQLFDSQNPSHAAAVKNFEIFMFSEEFLNSKPSIDQIQKLIESGTKKKLEAKPKINI